MSKWAQDFLDTNIQEKEARLEADLVLELESFKDDPFTESSHIEKLFWCPTSISFHNDNLLIVDSSRHRIQVFNTCLLYTSPSPRDAHESRMPSSA